MGVMMRLKKYPWPEGHWGWLYFPRPKSLSGKVYSIEKYRAEIIAGHGEGGVESA
jgi:hypothetical protein